MCFRCFLTTTPSGGKKAALPSMPCIIFLVYQHNSLIHHMHSWAGGGTTDAGAVMPK